MAACWDHPHGDWWFPPVGGGSTHAARAVEVCLSCRTRINCLVYATGNRLPFGIWGAASYRDRARLREDVSKRRYPTLWEAAESFIRRAEATVKGTTGRKEGRACPST